MLTAFGVGEVAISISSAPQPGAPVEHTVRDVGAVTHALCVTPVGGIVGVRGPFGTDWGLDDLDGADVVVVAGGIGLAPLRGRGRRARRAARGEDRRRAPRAGSHSSSAPARPTRWSSPTTWPAGATSGSHVDDHRRRGATRAGTATWAW